MALNKDGTGASEAFHVIGILLNLGMRDIDFHSYK